MARIDGFQAGNFQQGSDRADGVVLGQLSSMPVLATRAISVAKRSLAHGTRMLM
jgi:hypothetical protein